MLPAGPKPQAKSGAVEHQGGHQKDDDPKVGGNIRVLKQHRPQHRDLPQHRHGVNAEGVGKLNLLHPLDNPGHKDGKGRGEHVQSRAADGLVRLHIDGRIGVGQGEHAAGHHGDHDSQDQLCLPRQLSPCQVEKQDARKRPHDHNALQGNIHHAAALREHPPERHDHQRDRKKHCLLKDKIDHTHAWSPPSLLSSLFALRSLSFPRIDRTIRAKALK